MLVVAMEVVDQSLIIFECKSIRLAAGSDVGWEIKRETKNEPKSFGLSYWVD